MIHIGPNGMTSEEDVANIIAHELSHARDYRKGAGMIKYNHKPWLHKPHPDVYAHGDALSAYIRGER